MEDDRKCPYCGSTNWDFDVRTYVDYGGLGEETKEERDCVCVCGKKFKRVEIYTLIRCKNFTIEESEQGAKL